MTGGKLEAKLLQRLRMTGLRPTVARIGILQVLEAGTPERLDADTVFRNLLTRGMPISQGTVYRTLKDLVARDLILSEWRDGLSGKKAVYGLRERDTQTCDIQFVCKQCGHATELGDLSLQEQLQQQALRQGLNLAAQPMVILTVCAQCTPRKLS